jgi:hypothetical protein
MKMPRLMALLSVAILLSLLPSCQPAGPEFNIDYEQYQLDNGLSVVLHEDRSDPVTAVAILYHVGSGREEVGKTGFAHLFEHMMFQSSQNVPEDQFFQKIQPSPLSITCSRTMAMSGSPRQCSIIVGTTMPTSRWQGQCCHTTTMSVSRMI